ncbi:protein FAM169B isoform X2 [Platichthys flesus]|uniref:protein FAM169B isoform X2 n=1 Tax=Platichthys flesus TaxID=8260 RepID=UPI002DBC5035|nr:protein FAM169B isoform X2 [Platichthys flesus]
MFPVDSPDVKDTDLTSASEQYLSSLQSRPSDNDWFELSQTSKVEITWNNVRRLRLFEEDGPDAALPALHPPDEPTQVVALYLRERWWPVEDILRAVAHGEARRVPAESGSGEVFTAGGAVLPASPHRELQTAVDGQSGRRLLLLQTQRQPVRRPERSLLPAARPGHSAGEEELEEERLCSSDASGLLLLLRHGGVPGTQRSAVTQHGGSVQEVPAAARGSPGASVRGGGSGRLGSTPKHLAQHPARTLRPQDR